MSTPSRASVLSGMKVGWEPNTMVRIAGFFALNCARQAASSIRLIVEVIRITMS